MLHAAKISFTKMRNSILTHALISCLFYIGFLLLMKMLHLMHITELRMVNYVILCLVCMYQIKKWVMKTGAYIPFLQVFLTALFTGIASFVFFSTFLYIYTRFDVELNELFVNNTHEVFSSLPTIVVFFEGTAVSIIVALINLQYFRRYEEGEVSPKKEVRN